MDYIPNNWLICILENLNIVDLVRVYNACNAWNKHNDCIQYVARMKYKNKMITFENIEEAARSYIITKLMNLSDKDKQNVETCNDAVEGV